MYATPLAAPGPVFGLGALALGLLLGSFYNVCVHRYLAGESIVWPPSRCPDCGHRLSWWENIPIMSFLALRGRCRNCKAAISLRYPVVEALSGLWALALAVQYGPTWAWLAYMVMGGILIVASFIDLASFILPDILTLPGAALAFLAAVFVLGMDPVQSLLGAGIGAGTFLALQVGYRKLKGIEGLGTGDIKLMLLLGALLGPTALPIVVLGGSLAALAASVFFILQAKARGEGEGLKTAIPFGPFLSLGGMLAALYGDAIWRWCRGGL
jgi:leader peptidase (prepilin peptidase)/N-methyltransferase